MQSVQVNLQIAVDSSYNFCDWIKEYNLTGFDKIIKYTKIIHEIPTTFQDKSISKKKKVTQL